MIWCCGSGVPLLRRSAVIALLAKCYWLHKVRAPSHGFRPLSETNNKEMIYSACGRYMQRALMQVVFDAPQPVDSRMLLVVAVASPFGLHTCHNTLSEVHLAAGLVDTVYISSKLDQGSQTKESQHVWIRCYGCSIPPLVGV